jgi:N utilization substance protein B
MQKNRRKSRELALQALYACEIGDYADCRAVLRGVMDAGGADEDAAGYAATLVEKAYAERETIDALLQKHAANWDVKRMTAVDRNILRMAVAELMHFPEVPCKVVIDEAVELAKQYGTDDSGKFVNGVIDSIHKDMAPDKNSDR